MTRIAIIKKEKCNPLQCNQECKKYCPIEKKEKDSCIVIKNKAEINESTCVGCSICQKRCPFGAIIISNLPDTNKSKIIHRYGKNGFALYGLPIPKQGKTVGILGRNGIGKSTAIKILSNQEKINLGSEKEATIEELKEYFKGNEIIKYFINLPNLSISLKPQNISKLSSDIKVIELFEKIGQKERIEQICKKIKIDHLMNNYLNKLSGGELQKIAIAASTIKEADAYFFDEPLSYLDIGERIFISDYLKEVTNEKTSLIIEHDILMMDYISDYIQIFYGHQGAFGFVSQVRSAKNGINDYLKGYLKEENVIIRDKEITFKFIKNSQTKGQKLASWPSFEKEYETGFRLKVKGDEIHKNHCIGILGRNATGKSTFIKCLEGEEEVIINGKKQKLDLNLKISYKPQYIFNESEELVREVIYKEKIDKKILNMFNIEELQGKRIKELSGGELQRFSIARCLSKDADIYLLDEPSAYLDIEERISCASAIKDLMIYKEKTAFVIDHDLLLISYVSDSIINFEGIPGKEGYSSEIRNFEIGLTNLLKSVNITLRKDEESGRPRINKKDSVLDREQKEKNKWVII